MCACNQLLDAIARQRWNVAFDVDGARAETGRVDARLAQHFTAALAAQSGARRSLGTGDELIRAVDATATDAAETVARSAATAIAATIVAAVAGSDRLVLAGGGVRNRALVAELRTATRIPVTISDDLGLPHSYREAAAMAVLGALCQDRVAITLPAVTGVHAHSPIAGLWCLP